MVVYIFQILFQQFTLMYYGKIYAYQSFLSYLYTIIYLAVCIEFDNEIMALCEKIGFIRKTSRSMKFYLLFVIICLFIFASVLVSGSDDVWVRKTNWMINIIKVSFFPLC